MRHNLPCYRQPQRHRQATDCVVAPPRYQNEAPGVVRTSGAFFSVSRYRSIFYLKHGGDLRVILRTHLRGDRKPRLTVKVEACTLQYLRYTLKK
jgi:hypothetical protein